MRVTVPRTDLVAALKMCADAVAKERAAAVPALTGVKFAAADDTMAVSGTDMELSVTVTAGADVAEEGGVLLPAFTLTDLADKAVGDEVTIEVGGDGASATITTGSGEWKLRTLPVDAWPEPAEITTSAVSVPTTVFEELRSRITLAASKDVGRPILAGIHFEEVDGELTAVATDSYRLARLTLGGDAAEFPRCTVPAQAIVVAANAAEHGDGTETAAVRSDARHIHLDIGAVTVVSRLIEGDYPNWQKLVADAPRHFEFHVNAAELDAAVDRAAVLTARGDTPSVRFHVENGTVRISAAQADLGEGWDEIAVGSNGKGAEFAVNPKYLRDGIKAAAGQVVSVRGDGATKPLTLTGDSGTTYTLMPIRA